jgi:thiamine pyrophosphate-dependent acetolactate synthase large subunit-like protein
MTNEKDCIYVSSRGILKSCDFYSKTPISSISYLINYNEQLNNHKDNVVIYVCNTAIKDFINSHKKTIVITGSGCEKAATTTQFKNFLRNMNLPAITSIGSNHTIEGAGTLALGAFGPTGRRSANFALSEADSILVLGSGMDVDLTGFDRDSFFKNKRVMMINSDKDVFIDGIPKCEIIEANIKITKFNKNSSLYYCNN